MKHGQAERWTTFGNTMHAGRSLPLGVARGEAFDPAEGIGERLRFVAVGKGSGVFRRDGRSWPFRAPTYFCLDERETAEIDCSDVSGNLFVYFHPAVIHSSFDFSIIRGVSDAPLPLDIVRDVYWFSPFVRRADPADGIVIPGLALARRVDALSSQLADELAAQPTGWWPCRSRSFLIEMLFAIIQAVETTEAPASLPDADDGLLRRFLLEAGSRYPERLSVDGLARELGTNRTSLQRVVSEATGKSVAEYVAAVRLDAARALLAETDLPVAEIAERTGYADASAFSRAFKQGFNAAPSEYRKAYGGVLAPK